MIHLRTLNLEKVSEIEHYDLIKNLERDSKVQQYISKNLSRWLSKHQAESEDKIEIGKSYVIEKDNHYIGIVGSLSFSNEGILEVWYAIKKNFREKGYGEKILAEITPYLIEHVQGLNDIELKIDKNNKVSKKIAERNGYLLEESDKDLGIDIYHYFGRKR
ncbi:MAG: GNAT family N-acetyltransferase [Bacilli bacterium]|nr:GNAT family N-acetyltransferase [Bacilli bacterium]